MLSKQNAKLLPKKLFNVYNSPSSSKQKIGQGKITFNLKFTNI
uniref:Uncharacterized protein n=1 Tax=Arundo donax TaxID=35708 RepID=A0A0A8ZBU5_ARUDO